MHPLCDKIGEYLVIYGQDKVINHGKKEIQEEDDGRRGC